MSVDLARTIGRNVQVPAGAVTHGFKINLFQTFQAPHHTIFLWMIKPAWPDRYIHFCRYPVFAIERTCFAFCRFSISNAGFIAIWAMRGVGGPTGIFYKSSFVATPSYVRAYVTKDNSIRL